MINGNVNSSANHPCTGTLATLEAIDIIANDPWPTYIIIPEGQTGSWKDH